MVQRRNRRQAPFLCSSYRIIGVPSNSLDQLLRRQVPFSRATVADSVNERKHFVQGFVLQRSSRRGFVEGFETDASVLTLCEWPDGWRL